MLPAKAHIRERVLDDDYEWDRKILAESGESPERIAALDREVYGDLAALELEAARAVLVLCPPPQRRVSVSTRIEPPPATLRRRPVQTEQWRLRRREYLAAKGEACDC